MPPREYGGFIMALQAVYPSIEGQDILSRPLYEVRILDEPRRQICSDGIRHVLAIEERIEQTASGREQPFDFAVVKVCPSVLLDVDYDKDKRTYGTRIVGTVATRQVYEWTLPEGSKLSKQRRERAEKRAFACVNNVLEFLCLPDGVALEDAK